MHPSKSFQMDKDMMKKGKNLIAFSARNDLKTG